MDNQRAINALENIDKWQNNCRKVFANYYIDDKNKFFKKRKKKHRYFLEWIRRIKNS